MIPPEVPGFSLHTAFLMRFGRRAELTFKVPMRAKSNKSRRLFTTVALQDLLHRRSEIVITKFAEHAAKEGECQFMCFEESLLSRMQKRTMKCCPARHAAHRKHLQLGSLTRQIGISLVPIYLCFDTPRITLRHKRLVNDQAQFNLPLLHVQPHRAFAHLVLR